MNLQKLQLDTVDGLEACPCHLQTAVKQKINILVLFSHSAHSTFYNIKKFKTPFSVFQYFTTFPLFLFKNYVVDSSLKYVTTTENIVSEGD